MLQTDTGFFTSGIVAQGSIPEGSYGVEASFASPNASEADLDTNVSQMLHADSAGNFALKMAIGDGAVEFGVRIVAPAGSPLYKAAPSVAFIHKDTTEYFKTSGKLPWPNPVNIFTDTLGILPRAITE